MTTASGCSSSDRCHWSSTLRMRRSHTRCWGCMSPSRTSCSPGRPRRLARRLRIGSRFENRRARRGCPGSSRSGSSSGCTSPPSCIDRSRTSRRQHRAHRRCHRDRRPRCSGSKRRDTAGRRSSPCTPSWTRGRSSPLSHQPSSHLQNHRTSLRPLSRRPQCRRPSRHLQNHQTSLHLPSRHLQRHQTSIHQTWIHPPSPHQPNHQTSRHLQRRQTSIHQTSIHPPSPHLPRHQTSIRRPSSPPHRRQPSLRRPWRHPQRHQMSLHQPRLLRSSLPEHRHPPCTRSRLDTRCTTHRCGRRRSRKSPTGRCRSSHSTRCNCWGRTRPPREGCMPRTHSARTLRR